MDKIYANELNMPGIRDNREYDDRGRDDRGRDDRGRDDRGRDDRGRDDRGRDDRGRDDRGRDDRGRDDRGRDDRGRDDRGRDDRGRDDDRRNRRGDFGPREHFPQNVFPFPQDEIRYLQDGVIQRIFGDGRSRFVTVLMNMDNRFGPNQFQFITLVVTPTTLLRNQNLRPIRFQDLRVGMRISAAYSSRMTRSIPPQAVAFSIIAIIEEPYVVSSGRVAFVDTRNRTLTTGRANDINSQVIYNVTESTDIFDRNGFRIRLNQIRPGDVVRIEHATFQTASIPPQTTAYRIEIIR